MASAYKVDRAPFSAADLREALKSLIDAARKVGRAGRGPASTLAPTGEWPAARLTSQSGRRCGVAWPAFGRAAKAVPHPIVQW